MLEKLLDEVPNSKCTLPRSDLLTSGCLNSLAVYKSSLAKLQGDKGAILHVKELIKKLEKNDPMRTGRYQEWLAALE